MPHDEVLHEIRVKIANCITDSKERLAVIELLGNLDAAYFDYFEDTMLTMQQEYFEQLADEFEIELEEILEPAQEEKPRPSYLRIVKDEESK